MKRRTNLQIDITRISPLQYSKRHKQANKQMLQAVKTFEKYNPLRPMPQLTSNTVVFFDGASSSSKAWHKISAPCMVFKRVFTEGSCNSKPATVSWRLATDC